MPREKPLASRHRWAAFLIATGTSTAEVAKRTGLAVGVLTRLERSPLFRALVTQHEQEIIQRGYDKVLARLLSSADKTLRFFDEVLDGHWDDDVDRMRLRVDVAKTLLDRQAPRRQEIASQTTHRFVIGDEKKRALIEDCTEAGIPLDDAIREAQARDVTPD